MSRRVPAFLKALGRRPLPDTISLEDRTFKLRRVFKDDFFAVTAMYEHAGERIVLKINRTAWLGPVPLAWVGRFLAWRETGAYERLADVAGVPRFLGRWSRTGIVHAYVPGHPLAKGERVADDFHTNLRTIVDNIHRKNMAYVDLEKTENVLVGDDGRPYLFDFQIAFYWPWRRGGRVWPIRWLLRRFQAGDRYHLVKLRRRTRPDQLTPAQLTASYRRPWYVQVHRVLTRPLTLIRRAVLDRIDPRRGGHERGRVDRDVNGGVPGK